MLENSRDSAKGGRTAIGFERFSFNEKMIRFQHRCAAGMCTLENATIANSADIFSRIRGEIVIASDSAVEAVLKQNPMAVKRVSFSGKPVDKDGIFAYLPLNSAGVAALLSGAFDGLQPDPLHIAPPGEQPEAIYIWLIYMPHHGGRAIGALGALIDIAAPRACPIFSKAINLHAQQLNESLGFMPAQTMYPTAPSPLLVVLPRKDLETPKKQSVEVRLVRDLGDYTKIIAIRSATYIAEQFAILTKNLMAMIFARHIGLGSREATRPVAFAHAFLTILQKLSVWRCDLIIGIVGSLINWCAKR
jgi:hypothetical protein